MGKVFIVSGDVTLKKEETMWYFTSNIFNTLFRYKGFFKTFEKKQYQECFVIHGVEGIDLSDVSKETFNIFCLRLYETFKAFKTDYKSN